MFSTLFSLTRKGVIGLNERNLNYINENNPRQLLIRVDNKLETKRMAEAAGIAVPELYGSIANAWEMRSLEDIMRRSESFVIKPAMGSQGNGILVVKGRLRDGWRLANGRRITLEEIRFHINNILSGMYSLGDQPEIAMIE